MVDFADIINNIASLGDSIKESFTVLRDFLLSVELAAYSLVFILLFLFFLLLVFALVSSPKFFYDLYLNQRKAILSLMARSRKRAINKLTVFKPKRKKKSFKHKKKR